MSAKIRDFAVTCNGSGPTNAEFRTMLNTNFAAILESGGVIKTSDTGQIDWSTATYPASNNTSAGYEIRRFSDTMQSTAPVYLKLTYMRGSAAPRVNVIISIGTGSDGAGNLTGIKYTMTTPGFLFTSAVITTGVQFTSAGDNRFSTYISYTSNGGGWFGIERTVDGTNSVTSTGVLLIGSHAQAGSGMSESRIVLLSSYVQPSGEASGATFDGGCMIPIRQTSGTYGDGFTAIYPYYVFNFGVPVFPSLNFAGVYTGDFVDHEVYPVKALGRNQNMVKAAVGQAISPARSGSPGNTVAVVMVRWE